MQNANLKVAELELSYFDSESLLSLGLVQQTFCITDNNDGAIEASVSSKYVVHCDLLCLHLIGPNSADLPNNISEDALLKVYSGSLHRMCCVVPVFTARVSTYPAMEKSRR